MARATRMAMAAALVAIAAALPVVAPAEDETRPRRPRLELDGPLPYGASQFWLLYRGAVYYPAGLLPDTLALGPVVGAVDSRRLPPGSDATGLGRLPGCEFPRTEPYISVAGYATWFRIAVPDPNLAPLGPGYYEVGCNRRAKVGADVLDIRGRVVGVALRSEPGGREATVSDPAIVAALADAVLDAPVQWNDSPYEEAPGRYVRLVWLLPDGTGVGQDATPAGLRLAQGIIETPPGFYEELLRLMGDEPARATPGAEAPG